MTGTVPPPGASKSPTGGAYAAPEPPKQTPADAIKDKVAAARDWAGDAAGSARDWAAERGDKIKAAVTEEPAMVIGISAASAFAIGIVVGLFVGRLTAD